MSSSGQTAAPSTNNPSSDAGPEAGISSSPPQKSPRKKLLIGGTVGAAVLLIVIAGVVVVAALNGNRTATALAQEYFDALAAGDAETAVALLEESVTDEHTDLLTDDVLSSADELITDVDVRPSDAPLDSNDQKVAVSYTLAEEQHTEEVVVKRGEPEWGVLRSWEMPASIVPETIIRSDGEHPFAISDTVLDSGTTVRMFPAVYSVATAQSEYLELEQDTLELSNDEGSLTTLGIDYTPALVDETQQQINALIDECAATETNSWSEAADASPSACPLRVALPDVPGRVEGTWEILEYPTVDLREGASLLTTDGGLAAFTPEGRSTPVEMDRGVELVGSVDFTDSEPAVTLSDSS